MAVAGHSVYLGDYKGRLWKINTVTGQPEWVLPTPTFFTSSPAINDSFLFIGNIHGRIDAVHLSEGAQRWTFQIPSNTARMDSLSKVNWREREPTAKLSVLATVSIDASCLFYTASGGEVGCLNQSTGGAIWQTNTNDRIFASPLVTDKYLYITTMSSHFIILDKFTGEILQKLNITGSAYASPAIAGSPICFGTESGMIYGFTSKSE